MHTKRTLLLSSTAITICSVLVGCGNTTQIHRKGTLYSRYSNSVTQDSSQKSGKLPKLSSLIDIPTNSYSICVSTKSLHGGNYPFKISKQRLSDVDLSSNDGRFKEGKNSNDVTKFGFIKTLSKENPKQYWLLLGNNNSLIIHFTTWATKSSHSSDLINVGIQVPANFMEVRVVGASNQHVSVNTNSIYPYYQFRVHSSSWYKITYGYGNSTSTVRVKFSYK